ncbi:MAG: histidine phosphatase family protein [Christensenellales bacterium]|jgi:broad specificity phosphatase PhoE
MKLELFLVRHGETVLNAERRYCGRLDVPLSERGERQALTLPERLPLERIKAVYSSDMIRAVQTAKPLCEALNMEPVLMPGLRELDFGDWEGMIFEDVRKQYAEQHAGWVSGKYNCAQPGGETSDNMFKRVGASIDSIIEKGLDAAVVAHGGCIRFIIMHLLDLPFKYYWNFMVDNTSIIRLVIEKERAMIMFDGVL